MRIDETPSSPHFTPPVQRPPVEVGKPHPYDQQLPDGPEAAVEVSDEARLLQRTKQLAQATPDVRKERVAEIRRQIESGTYQVDPRQLARRILEDLGVSQ
ncbi:MAG TPA: flagellar biosynthesis anti-sigma factor FlgM [Chloroflexota bacterium]